MISLLGGTIYESDIPIKKNSKCLCERERERDKNTNFNIKAS